MEPHTSPPTLEDLDPDPDSDSDSAPPSDFSSDLAAQMGFASFGAQPSAKKRKYNPAADAMTSFLPPTHASLPRKPPPSVGTGANSGTLGWAGDRHNGGLSERSDRGGHERYAEGERGMGRDRVLGGGARRGRGGRGGGKGNGEEASGSNSTPLGTRTGREGKNDADERLGMRIGLALSPDLREERSGAEDDGMPRYVDSTPPSSPFHRKNTYLTNEAEVSPVDGEVTLARQVEEQKEEVDGDAGPVPFGHPLASSDRPEDLPVRTHQSQSREGYYDWNALRKGVRNEKGDLVYYDASFVEDPWKDLVGR
ncbi:hypothetical protein MMC26_003935 [Xylographa opegraphella]|nr:hypothetical protein [Xylographa opegraphella]